MIRMTAIVSSMVRCLLRAHRARSPLSSNGCATAGARRCSTAARVFVASIHLVSAIGATAEVVRAQETPPPPVTQNVPSTASSVGLFFLGAGSALAAHEGGHLLFDAIFDASPGVKKVSYKGIPFFAITHDPGLPNRQEFVIDSAGFWVQEGTNEWLLHKHPDLRHEHQPYLKGAFAFNVLASVVYAGAAFLRTGPPERDTRGMAAALHWKEPYVGLLILAPAILDAVRYYQPRAKWAEWGSRGAKVTGVLLVFK
jgi:hypothetical protein